ncbi:hypothetical protein ELUMI_v1c04580 [Williamsoniiplasma luminosum]|uniref:DUF2130 domain-containing protein n=1 Tax=Williamsoniiplasma luminosum TaxID=214888 RepID=A0A2K8NTL6_9MOLU|nr:DUF2130 domain-containing protein [Williamsoniiplasma luminosum]ATZ17182.1 hypothetical protein ELUMI_v1c04580 [Williamsoniiplasma luminosum]
MSNINLTCPKCGQDFSFDQLFDHNKEAFNDLINQKVKEKLSEKIGEEKQLILRDAENKLNLEKVALEKSFNEKENKFVNEINQLNLELEKQQEQITLQIGQEVLQKEQEMQKLLNAKNEENSKQINELINQINGLKLEVKKQQEEASLKIGQEVLLKEKEIQKSIDLKNEETAKKQADFVNQINKLQVELEKQQEQMILKITHEVLLKEKEMQKLLDEKNEEIQELNLKNSTFKVMHSKAKGENFEHEVETELRKGFGILDEIKKINADIDGTKADFLQVVKDSTGTNFGSIVYEVKNAEWKDSWVSKLSIDVAKQKAKFGILITTSFNDKYKGDTPFIKSEEFDNIWITDANSFIFIGQVIRKLVENEYKWNQELKKLMELSKNDELQNLYQKQKEQLNKFIKENLPSLWKRFDKQIKDLESIERSLNKSAGTIEKSRTIIYKIMTKDIIGFMSKLTQTNLDFIINEQEGEYETHRETDDE